MYTTELNNCFRIIPFIFTRLVAFQFIGLIYSFLLVTYLLSSYHVGRKNFKSFILNKEIFIFVLPSNKQVFNLHLFNKVELSIQLKPIIV